MPKVFFIETKPHHSVWEKVVERKNGEILKETPWKCVKTFNVDNLNDDLKFSEGDSQKRKMLHQIVYSTEIKRENIELEGRRKMITISCPKCGKINPEVNPYCVICKFKPLLVK